METSRFIIELDVQVTSIVKRSRSQWPRGLRHEPFARSLERWDRGFESHSRHECLYCVRLFCVCVILGVGRGLATG
jgi:hypothetical protein